MWLLCLQPQQSGPCFPANRNLLNELLHLRLQLLYLRWSAFLYGIGWHPSFLAQSPISEFTQPLTASSCGTSIVHSPQSSACLQFSELPPWIWASLASAKVVLKRTICLGQTGFTKLLGAVPWTIWGMIFQLVSSRLLQNQLAILHFSEFLSAAYTAIVACFLLVCSIDTSTLLHHCSNWYPWDFAVKHHEIVHLPIVAIAPVLSELRQFLPAPRGSRLIWTTIGLTISAASTVWAGLSTVGEGKTLFKWRLSLYPTVDILSWQCDCRKYSGCKGLSLEQHTRTTHDKKQWLI